MTAIAPIINRRRMSRWPIFEVLPRSGLPPVECCRGTSPSHVWMPPFAQGVSGVAWSRDRVRWWLRPRMRLGLTCRGRRPMEMRGPGADQSASCELVGFSCISWPGSDRSFALTVRRPPHAPDVSSAAQSDRGSAHCGCCPDPIIFAPSRMAQIARAILLASAIADTHPWLTRQHAVQPASLCPPFREAERMTAIAPIINRRRMSRWPIFEVLPRSGLPPVECCRGTSPSQAACMDAPVRARCFMNGLVT